MKRKYLIIGDYVISKSDGDRHYISAQQLSRLYGVNPQDSIMVDKINEEEKLAGLNMDDFTVLRPRYDGDYGSMRDKPN